MVKLTVSGCVPTRGLPEKLAVTGSYAVSSGLLILGRALLNPAGLVTLAQPVVKVAQEATGETIMPELTRRYARALGRHREDRVLGDGKPPKSRTLW